ncbi:InlB B-repeat-containing protein [Pseudoflavonifractor sp. MSJ-30]|uniref:InlB B-repeat-containing protein n=1 Tax=Pseudoflavonifractor sp. MSJ-30 TaxID=2841525 RepID=UPI00353010CA
MAAAPYTVSFDSNGGSNNPLPMTTGTDGKLANLPSPGTRTGYTFSAWKNGEQAVDENTVYTDDATLTAEWLPITYNVIFDANGGVNANNTGSQSFRDVKYGETLSPAAVTRASHRFLGWSRSRDGGQIVAELQNLTATQGETVTLYAKWEYQAKNITFDADGGIINSSGSRVPTVTVQTQAEPLDTIDASRFPMPEARRYLTFVGWFTEKNGKGTQVTPSGGITDGTVFTEDTTVYAYWKYEPLTITLDCKGGTVRVNGQDVKKTTMQTRYPGIVDGILPTPTRKGYTFLGWYLSDGTKVDNTTLYEKDTTIYARWQGTGKWNPKTGDQIMLGLSLTILTAAAAGLGAAVVLRKRKK